MLKKIISGGQTGADQGGLNAALKCGIPTGGWMPKGWKTEEGSRPGMARRYLMKETSSSDYIHRTKLNIVESDATLIFGDINSAGSYYTERECIRIDKPYLVIPRNEEHAVEKIYTFLCVHSPDIVNVAGNRESKSPGIHQWVKSILVDVFTKLKAEGLVN